MCCRFERGDNNYQRPHWSSTGRARALVVCVATSTKWWKINMSQPITESFSSHMPLKPAITSLKLSFTCCSSAPLPPTWCLLLGGVQYTDYLCSFNVFHRIACMQASQHLGTAFFVIYDILSTTFCASPMSGQFYLAADIYNTRRLRREHYPIHKVRGQYEYARHLHIIKYILNSER